MKEIVMRTAHTVIFLPFLIILLIVTPVIGSEWVEFGKSDEGDVFLYDKGRMQHTTKDMVRVWGKTVYSDENKKLRIKILGKSEEPIKGLGKLTSGAALLEIDCKDNRAKILHFAYYDDNGNVLYSDSDDKPDWSRISPDSMLGILRNKVCK